MVLRKSGWRRRGVCLTQQGFKKLQAARSQAEFSENFGQRFTLAMLHERTNLSVETLTKIFAGTAKVDKQTLQYCFNAFNLDLEPSDYFSPPPQANQVSDAVENNIQDPEFPEGQVPLNSPFYVNRPPIEAECYRAILQPGALIRIRAPRWMGKTSLMSRVLQQTAQQGYHAIFISFQLADKAIFQNLDRFLRWFCASVSVAGQLPNQLDNYWDELYGSKLSCKMYFEQYLLTNTTVPIVLGLDDVDQLFQYPEVADEFFGLLRTWHEEAKNREIWAKLRIIVAHSAEVYIPININKSPFNVGVAIQLLPFTSEQILDLASRYSLNLSAESVEELLLLVGGHPYLTRLALYHLWRNEITVEQLSQLSELAGGIYKNHLQRQLWRLQQQPELLFSFAQLLQAETSMELSLIPAFKLQSIGLVNCQGEQAIVSCRLYDYYFRERLKDGLGRSQNISNKVFPIDN